MSFLKSPTADVLDRRNIPCMDGILLARAYEASGASCQLGLHRLVHYVADHVVSEYRVALVLRMRRPVSPQVVPLSFCLGAIKHQEAGAAC